MRRKQDQWLYDAFAREVSIPETMEARLADSLALVRQKSRGKDTDMKHHHRRGWKTALLIAAVVALLAGTAVAAGMHTGFFESAYGDEGKRPQWTEPKFDAHGNQTGTYTFPAVQGFEVDEEKADRLLGDYISDIEKTIEVDGYTITLHELVMDENGIGSILLDVENPDGLGEMLVSPLGKHSPPIIVQMIADMDIDFPYFGHDYVVVESSITDTSIRYVTYLTPMFDFEPGTDLIVEAVSENTASITLSAPELIPAATFSGGGVVGKLSPVGLKLIWDKPTGFVSEDRITFGKNDSGDVYVDGKYYGNLYMGLVWEELAGPGTPPSIGDFRIRFKDGSEYILQSETIYNTQGYVNDWTTWYAFNNLVDVEEVEAICIDDMRLLPAE